MYRKIHDIEQGLTFFNNGSMYATALSPGKMYPL